MCNFQTASCYDPSTIVLICPSSKFFIMANSFSALWKCPLSEKVYPIVKSISFSPQPKLSSTITDSSVESFIIRSWRTRLLGLRRVLKGGFVWGNFLEATSFHSLIWGWLAGCRGSNSCRLPHRRHHNCGSNPHISLMVSLRLFLVGTHVSCLSTLLLLQVLSGLLTTYIDLVDSKYGN